VLPGFRPALAYTLTYLTLLVLIPLAACFFEASTLSPAAFVRAVWTDRARAAYALTVGASLIAAAINAFLGLLVAWVLVRYDFPLRRVFDALVDLPFALPTAVAGLVFSSLYAKNGWLGQFLVPLGIEVAYNRLGIVLVLVFTGFPFVVRSVQPILEGLEPELEEAAAILGASRLQTFRKVIWPPLVPALLTGFALALARALGEYGSVVFISGNRPFRTEIAPYLIVARLEEYAYPEAAAIACVLLVMSLALLLAVNLLERWSKHHGQ
jgi:sulfate transport system permease protein